MGDALGGSAVAEDLGDAAGVFEPGGVGDGFFEEGGEVVGALADEACDTGLDAFGAFGVFAQDEDGFAEGGGFFLDAARVGDEEPGVGEEMDEVGVAHGGGEDDLVATHEFLDGGFFDGGVGVDGEDDAEVGVRLGEAAQGAQVSAHGIAEVFSAMGGEEDEFTAPDLVTEGADFAAGLGAGEGLEKGVHDGVAGDMDAVSGNAFG